MLPFRFLFFDPIRHACPIRHRDIALSVNLTLARYGLPPLDVERVRSVGPGPTNLICRSFKEQGSKPEAIDEACPAVLPIV